MVWQVPGHNHLSGWYHSLDEFLGFMGQVGALSGGSFNMETISVIVEGDWSADITRNRGKRADSAKAMDIEVVHVLRWTDGKVIAGRGRHLRRRDDGVRPVLVARAGRRRHPVGPPIAAQGTEERRRCRSSRSSSSRTSWPTTSRSRSFWSKMTDTFISVVGEVARPFVYCIIQETPQMEWSIGGKAMPDLAFLIGPEYTGAARQVERDHGRLRRESSGGARSRRWRSRRRITWPRRCGPAATE